MGLSSVLFSLLSFHSELVAKLKAEVDGSFVTSNVFAVEVLVYAGSPVSVNLVFEVTVDFEVSVNGVGVAELRVICHLQSRAVAEGDRRTNSEDLVSAIVVNCLAVLIVRSAIGELNVMSPVAIDKSETASNSWMFVVGIFDINSAENC